MSILNICRFEARLSFPIFGLLENTDYKIVLFRCTPINSESTGPAGSVGSSW